MISRTGVARRSAVWVWLAPALVLLGSAAGGARAQQAGGAPARPATHAGAGAGWGAGAPQAGQGDGRVVIVGEA